MDIKLLYSNYDSSYRALCPLMFKILFDLIQHSFPSVRIPICIHNKKPLWLPLCIRVNNTKYCTSAHTWDTSLRIAQMTNPSSEKQASSPSCSQGAKANGKPLKGPPAGRKNPFAQDPRMDRTRDRHRSVATENQAATIIKASKLPLRATACATAFRTGAPLCISSAPSAHAPSPSSREGFAWTGTPPSVRPPQSFYGITPRPSPRVDSSPQQ
jgi:hypothetical protein